MRYPRHYKYFLIAKVSESQEGSVRAVVGITVRKALTAKNAENYYAAMDWYSYTHQGDGYYSSYTEHYVIGDKNGYPTEQAAKKAFSDVRQAMRKELNLTAGDLL